LDNARVVHDDVIDAYGLNNAVITAVDIGSYNIHFKIESEGERFDLRKSNRPSQIGNLDYESEILNHLRTKGFTLVPEVVATKSGAYNLWVDGRGWILFKMFTEPTSLPASKFLDQNPNPVLRITGDQVVEYANPSSKLTLRAIGVEVGEKLPDNFFEKIKAISDSGSSESVEVSADERTFSLLVVGVFEFGFINLYGTEITAALELEKAHQENELLLLNILPAEIADRLKQGEGLIADKFDDMSVLFADVVGFTPMSQNMSPSDLVEMLNTVLSLFDNIADKYNLEKIKTISDAYMVAGRLGTGGGGHVQNMTDMSIEMLVLLEGYRKDTGIDIRIRIGMHTGPAVAGVVGLVHLRPLGRHRQHGKSDGINRSSESNSNARVDTDKTRRNSLTRRTWLGRHQGDRTVDYLLPQWPN